MSDVCIAWFKEKQGPCVLCGDETVAGLVGWNQGEPVGPVCDTCMVDQERILGALLRKARAQGNGGTN